MNAKSIPRRCRTCFIALAVLSCVTPFVSFAHGFDPALLDLREQDHGRFEARFTLPDSYAGPVAPTPQFPCATVEEQSSPQSKRARFLIDCGAQGLRGRAISIRDLDGHTDVLVRITFQDGEESTGVLRGDTDRVDVKLSSHPQPGALKADVFTSYARLGIAHILSGADHLLFLLALLFLVDGVASLAAAITAFTLAHSLALALAALGLVSIPQSPVEALIAASIVLLAAELVHKSRAESAPPSLLRRSPALAAFAFGLLHGLGFAGALSETGLPADHIPLALLSFNLGVEAGQLAFVAALGIPVWAWLRVTSRRMGLRMVPGYVIGSVAMAWFIERVGGVF